MDAVTSLLTTPVEGARARVQARCVQSSGSLGTRAAIYETAGGSAQESTSSLSLTIPRPPYSCSAGLAEVNLSRMKAWIGDLGYPPSLLCHPGIFWSPMGRSLGYRSQDTSSLGLEYSHIRPSNPLKTPKIEVWHSASDTWSSGTEVGDVCRRSEGRWSAPTTVRSQSSEGIEQRSGCGRRKRAWKRSSAVSRTWFGPERDLHS